MKTPKLRLPGFSSTPEEREARRAKHQEAKQERAAKAAASSPPSAAVVAALQPSAPSVRINAFRIGLVGGIGVLVALVIGSIVSQLSTTLIYVGVALFIALGLDPLVSWLEQKLPRGLAIAVVFLAVIGAFVGIIFAIVPLLVTQISNFVSDYPRISQQFLNSDFVAWVQNTIGNTLDIDSALNDAFSFLKDPNNLLNIGGGIVAVGAGVASGITGSIIVLILTLYFLASLRSMKAVTYRFLPAYRREGFAQVLEEITQAVGRYVVGQVGLALVNGVLSFIFLSIIGAPFPPLLALLAFIGSMIPLVGTLSASIVNSALCLFVSPVTALIAIIYYLIYMQIEAYFLSPRIMNKAVAVPGALVVIAAFGGGALGGILGALVAIPVAASIIIIVQKVVFPSQDSKVVPENKLGDAETAAVGTSAAAK
ncbi:AI-2E family transporter [Plantibacter sp. MCCC 1A11337]|uniref:AI-2E family transporter n=1 Tax=Plantibacter TaxID=190323 RepID=UPI0007D9A7FC|nr:MULTISPECIES: AI-2E family transporter [unclassified Plantibacter]NUJ88748.1 AI-2E family transporter [Plantibacter sp. MCCC 1A11337]OII43328.1 AI-2E family transporter [Plantibacter sp. MMLR14_011]